MNQSIFTKRIDQARNAARVTMNLEDRFHRENFVWIGTPCHLHPLAYVAVRFLQFQRLQLGAQSDSLLQLPQIDRIELFVQLRLTNQQDLQQLFLRRFQIRQKSNFFENLRGEMVGFVNNKDSGQSLLKPRDHKSAQLQQQFTLRLA